MDLFATFKETLKRSVGALKKQDDPAVALLEAISAADNWEGLERRLVELRAVGRKRQQEVLERLGPLAERIEGLLANAREAKVKVMRQNLLRQAEGFMQELESEDEPAKIHASNCAMLTNIIKQVRRARAMAERTIDADAIDSISTHLEEIVVAHESTLEAAGELEEAGQIATPGEVSVATIEKRLSAVYDTGEAADAELDTGEAGQDIEDLEKKLYE